jgi:hypothetical protein
MTLGQVTEIIAMFMLGGLLLKWRLKWIFACGLAFGVVRFALCAINGKGVAAGGRGVARLLVHARVSSRPKSIWTSAWPPPGARGRRR